MSLRFWCVSLAIVSSHAVFARTCSYETWEWDTRLKKSVNHRSVTKNRADLTAEERGSEPGCTVCREDQREISLQNIPKFSVCKKFSAVILSALKTAEKNGFKFRSVTGYRVGMSKGPLSAQGIRTQFSHHSYGTALDINADENGLYDDCPQFAPACRLLRGGAYDPRSPLAVTPSSAIYIALKKAGFRWGGELRGNQKDFMHFSRDGS